MKSYGNATKKNVGSNEVQDDEVEVYEKYSDRPLNPILECATLLKAGFGVRDHRVINRLILSGQLILDGMVCVTWS